MAKKATVPTPNPKHRVAVFLDDVTFSAVQMKAIELQKQRKGGHASMADYIGGLIAADLAKKGKIRDQVYA